MIFPLPVQNTTVARNGSQSAMAAIDFERAPFYEYLKNNDAVLIGSGMEYRVIQSSKAIPAGWDLVTRLPAPAARQIRR